MRSIWNSYVHLSRGIYDWCASSSENVTPFDVAYRFAFAQVLNIWAAFGLIDGFVEVQLSKSWVILGYVGLTVLNWLAGVKFIEYNAPHAHTHFPAKSAAILYVACSLLTFLLSFLVYGGSSKDQ